MLILLSKDIVEVLFQLIVFHEGKKILHSVVLL